MAELKWTAIAVPGISALVGGAVGALLTVSVLRSSGSSADATPRPEPVAPANLTTPPAIEQRLASLERDLMALALKDKVARASTPPAVHTGLAERAPIADVAPIVDNPVFEAAVRDVMDRAEQERTLERDAQRAEWRKTTAVEWGAKLGEKLRLTEMQKAKVTEIAQAFWDRLHELRQGDAGAPLSRQQWRERAAELRKTSEAELAKILDHSQLTSYNELDETDKLGTPRSVRAAQRGP